MKISIITVCYNSESTIEDTIKSVLSQDYDDIEYIIIDGGSKDGTIGIVDNYADRIAKIVSEPDKGIYDAMNKGIRLATGDLIGILNSDDFYPRSNVISDVVEAKKSNPAASLVCGNVQFVSVADKSRYIRFYSSQSFSNWKLRFGFMPAHPATFVSRKVYEVLGGYKLGYKIAADFEMFIRILLVSSYKLVKINKTLVYMRDGGVSSSGLKSYLQSTKEQLRALRENSVYSNYFFVLSRLPIKFTQKIRVPKS